MQQENEQLAQSPAQAVHARLPGAPLRPTMHSVANANGGTPLRRPVFEPNSPTASEPREEEKAVPAPVRRSERKKRKRA